MTDGFVKLRLMFRETNVQGFFGIANVILRISWKKFFEIKGTLESVPKRVSRGNSLRPYYKSLSFTNRIHAKKIS